MMRRRWRLTTRLLAAMVLVLGFAVATAWAVFAAVGPSLFQLHLRRSGSYDREAFVHAQRAFADASTFSIALALAAGVLGAGVVSAVLARRMGHSLGRVRQASSQVAAGDYTARVPTVGMGADFDELASAFNTMARDLGRTEQTRRQLLGDLSHELRTPVAIIDGYLEALIEGVAKCDSDTLAMLRDQTARLTRLAEDVGLVLEAEEGRLSMRWQHVPLVELLEAATAAMSARFASRGVRLQVSTDGLAGTGVRGDPDRLAQVMTNLLDNALRHTHPDGIVEVVAAHRANGCVEVSVVDEGEGIAPEHLPHLFERFYRADTSRSRQYGGSGVGLALVRSITEAHGGTVQADSPGKSQGAVFTVSLPVSQP